MKTRKWTRSKHFFEVFKFAIVGAINTAIDLAVLNFLILLFHTGKSGFYFGVFKSISFLAALTNSYFLNRAWTFKGSAKKKTHIQIGQFVAVSLIGLGINVAASSIFVNSIRPPGAKFAALWPSVAALFGVAIGLIWNYFGYKFLVFKGEEPELLPPA